MKTSLKNILSALLSKFKKKCDDTYVAKDNVKTINGNSIVGKGNIALNEAASMVFFNNDTRLQPDGSNHSVGVAVWNTYANVTAEDLVLPGYVSDPNGNVYTIISIDSVENKVWYKFMYNLISDSDYTNINSSIIPKESELYDLGSVAKKWRDLYVSNGIYYKGKELSDYISNNSTPDLYKHTTRLVLMDSGQEYNVYIVWISSIEDKITLENSGYKTLMCEFDYAPMPTLLRELYPKTNGFVPTQILLYSEYFVMEGLMLGTNYFNYDYGYPVEAIKSIEDHVVKI